MWHFWDKTVQRTRSGFRFRSPVACLYIVVNVGLISGCGPSGPQIAKVEGTVTLDGDPLPDAFVFFRHEEGGRISRAITDERGFYSLNFNREESGAIVGKNAVRLSTLVEPRFTDGGQMIPGTARKERVPEKYRKEGELFVTVEPRTNTFDFELSSKD